MNSGVNLQILGTGKGFVADFTGKWPFAGVHSEVVLKGDYRGDLAEFCLDFTLSLYLALNSLPAREQPSQRQMCTDGSD